MGSLELWRYNQPTRRSQLYDQGYLQHFACETAGAFRTNSMRPFEIFATVKIIRDNFKLQKAFIL